MSNLARLAPRLSVVKPRLVTANAGQGWQKNGFNPVRPLSGQQRKKRNDRIKLRDKYTCQDCGRITPDLEIDHIVPLSQGGTESDSNLQSLCAGVEGCHGKKTKREAAGVFSA